MTSPARNLVIVVAAFKMVPTKLGISAVGAVFILACAMIGGVAALVLYVFTGLGATPALMIAFGAGPVAACAVLLVNLTRRRRTSRPETDHKRKTA